MWERLGKRNIIALLLVGIGVLSIPLGVDLLQKQQTLNSQAAEPPLTADLRTWAKNVNVQACVGAEFAEHHQGNLPTSIAQLEAWGKEGESQGHHRLINRGRKCKNGSNSCSDADSFDKIEWECKALSEGSGRGWRDRPDEDLYRHLAAVETTFQSIMCRPVTRPEWVHWGYNRNIPISQIRAELAASEEGLAHTRAGGCTATSTTSTGATTVTGSGQAPAAPTALRASAFCSSSAKITLRWRSGVGATSYKVKVNGSEVPNVVVPSDVAVRPYVVYQATKGSSYSWSVQSVNSSGVSSEVSGTQFRCN